MNAVSHRTLVLCVLLPLGGLSPRPTPAGEGPKEPGEKAFAGRLILFGVGTKKEMWSNQIMSMAPDGGNIRTLFKPAGGGEDTGVTSGRIAPDGRRLAFGFWAKGDAGPRLRLLGPDMKQRELAARGEVMAWSPDGKQVALCRPKDGSRGEYESVVVDTETGKESPVGLPGDYLLGDWHPAGRFRTCVYLNPRNYIYREKQKDRYPLRQLDLLLPTGKRVPVSKDPSSDNLDSRISPKGDLIAHYRRHVIEGRPRECGVVCKEDGSGAREVIDFSAVAKADKLYWFRPHAEPAWSPDGKLLAWIVHTRKAEGQQMPDVEVVIVPAGGGKPRRVPMAEKGITWVQAIDWR